jgi:PAS domain S-box-containing protein
MGGLLTRLRSGTRAALVGALLVLGLLVWLISKALSNEFHFTWIAIISLVVVALATLVWITFLVNRRNVAQQRSGYALPLGQMPLDRLLDEVEQPDTEVRLRRWAKSAVAAAVLLTLLLSFLSWRGAQQATETADWVAHTHEVMAALEGSLRHLLDVETGGRGFAETGSAPFLEPYESGRRAVVQDLNALRHLLVTPDQLQRLSVLEEQTNNQVKDVEEVVEARRKSGQIPILALFEQGKHDMDAVRITVEQMEVVEKGLLTLRTQRASAAQHSSGVVIALGSILGVIFLSIAGMTVNREIGVSARARGQVKAINALLERRVEQRTAALKESEAKLIASEQMSRTLLDGIRDYAVYMLDREGRVVGWNFGAARIEGYQAEEIIGKHVSCFYLQSDLDRNRPWEALQHAEATGHFEGQGWRVRQDGSTFWANVVIAPLLDGNGVLRGYSKVVRDITEQKKAEDKLKSHAALLDQASDAIIVRDLENRVVFINRAAQRMYGLSAEGASGRVSHELLQTKFPIALTAIEAALASDGEWAGELRHTTREGLEVVVASRWTMQRDEQGTPTAILEINRDITERKRAEEMLERLAAIVDSSEDAIISKTLDGTIAAWNRGAEKVFGYMASEIVGKSMRVLLPPGRIDEESDILARISRGESMEHFETVRVRKDGTPIDISVTISPIRDTKGGVVGASKVARDITERKLAEEALREKERRLSESQRIAHIGSWAYDLKDPEGRFTWSDELYRLYGVSPGTFVPTMESLLSLILIEDQPVIQKWMMACAAGEKPSDVDFRIRLPDGTVRVFSRRGELQCDSDNEPLRMVGTSQDITERRQVEAALKESEEQLLDMANGIPQLAWIAGADGSISWYNQRWYEFTGTTLEQMKGWGWQSVHHPDFLAKVLAGWTSALADGRPFEMEFPLRGADGLFRAFLTRVMPLKDSNGRVVRWFGTNTDISQLKETEERLAMQAEELRLSRQALETQASMLQTVLDSMVEGLVAADESGKFILWNPAAKKIMGLGPTSVPSHEWSTHYGLYLPDTVTPIPVGETPLERTLRGESVTTEMFLRRAGANLGLWLEANGSPLIGKDGVRRGGVLAFRDITRRKTDELVIRNLNEELEDRIAKRTEQLEASNHELEAFSYSVSHDLRTPLRHIAGFSRILVKEHGPTMAAEAREHLQRIEDAVSRMGLLIDALLKMAVLRRQPLRLRRSELNPIVDEVVSMLQPECEGRDVEWRVAKLPALDCDPILMVQVFQNLLGNAMKYSRGRTRAVIAVDSIQQLGKPAIIFVRDNGAGFDMKYAEKLFGVFQRFHTDAEFEGTGVGLATVQRIIQKHGGTIWAETEPDHGATFYFALQTTSRT